MYGPRAPSSCAGSCGAPLACRSRGGLGKLQGRSGALTSRTLHTTDKDWRAMQRLLVIASLLALVCAWVPAVHAEPQGQGVDISQSPVAISQVIRQAGYSLTDAEAAYLDGEQQLQGQYVRPLLQIVTLAGSESGVPEGP